MLMTYQPIPPERILAIVDDLFMPLVAINHRRSDRKSRRRARRRSPGGPSFRRRAVESGSGLR
jgi:hypothetical protein